MARSHKMRPIRPTHRMLANILLQYKNRPKRNAQSVPPSLSASFTTTFFLLGPLAGLVSLGVSAATAAGASADASVSIGSTAADASESGFSSAGLDSALVPEETSAAGVSAAVTAGAAGSEEG